MRYSALRPDRPQERSSSGLREARSSGRGNTVRSPALEPKVVTIRSRMRAAAAMDICCSVTAMTIIWNRSGGRKGLRPSRSFTTVATFGSRRAFL